MAVGRIAEYHDLMRAFILFPQDGAYANPAVAMRLLGGRPLLEHQLTLLRQSGITNITVGLRPVPDTVRAYFGSGESFGVQLTYAPGAEASGDWLAASRADADESELLLLEGDVLADPDLRTLIAAHRVGQADATIMVRPEEGSACTCVVELAEDDRIRRCGGPAEVTGRDLLSSAGIWLLGPSAVRALSERDCWACSADALRLLLRQRLVVHGHHLQGYHQHVGSPAGYRQVEEDIRAGRVRPPAGGPRHWYVARSKPRAEWLAAMAFEARGLTAYVPEWRGRRWAGTTGREALFPNYLFFRTDGAEDALVRARSVPNVTRLLGGDHGPEPVPDELIEALRRRCAAQGQQPFAAGQRVRIARGPFRDLDGVFEAACSGGQRARVFVQMLRRLVPVIVDMDMLSRAR